MTTAAGDAGLLARYRTHLWAVFQTACTCEDDTCGACIAEHALFLVGDHDAVDAVHTDDIALLTHYEGDGRLDSRPVDVTTPTPPYRVEITTAYGYDAHPDAYDVDVDDADLPAIILDTDLAHILSGEALLAVVGDADNRHAYDVVRVVDAHGHTVARFDSRTDDLPAPQEDW